MSTKLVGQSDVGFCSAFQMKLSQIHFYYVGRLSNALTCVQLV